MLQELENALSQCLGRNRRTIQSILKNVKMELWKKVTGGKVLGAVSHMIGEANRGVQNTK